MLIRKGFTKQELDSFFDLISLTTSTFNIFNKQHPIKFYQSEVQSTILYKKPFLLHNNKYWIWDIKMIDELVKYGIYNIIKIIMQKKKMGHVNNELSLVFENYINSLLFNSYDYVTESDLKKQKFKNQVDFIINKDNTRVIIEAKAIEASKLTKFTDLDDILKNAYEKDITKAIYQSNSVINQYDDKLDNFLIIVTYKNLFLGDGEDIWNEFLEDSYKSNEKYNKNPCSLLPENIFILDISELEMLLSNKNDIVSNLIRIKGFKKTNKKWLFSQYIEDLDN